MGISPTAFIWGVILLSSCFVKTAWSWQQQSTKTSITATNTAMTNTAMKTTNTGVLWHDSLAEAYDAINNKSVFWRNITQLPRIWPDNKLTLNLTTGWFHLDFNKKQSALIKVPAYTTLRLIDPDHSVPSGLSLAWSEGDGLFSPTQAEDDSNARELFILNTRAFPRYLRIHYAKATSHDKTAYQPALFLAEPTATQALSYQTKHLTPLPATTIERLFEHDKRKAYLLQPGERMSLRVTNTSMLRINPKLRYGNNNADTQRPLTLHWQWDNAASKTLTLQTTMDYRHRYKIAGEPSFLSQSNRFWLPVSGNQTTLHIQVEQPTVLEIDAFIQADTSLTALNGLIPTPEQNQPPCITPDEANISCRPAVTAAFNTAQKARLRQQAQAIAAQSYYRDIRPRDNTQPQQQRPYRHHRLNSTSPVGLPTYLTEAQRYRLARQYPTAYFTTLSQKYPVSHYSLPTRQQASRLRLLISLPQGDKHVFRIHSPGHAPLLVDWDSNAVSNTVNDASLSDKARQQLGLTDIPRQEVAMTELALPTDIKQFDIEWLTPNQQGVAIAVQYLTYKVATPNEQNYTELLRITPNAQQVWLTLLQSFLHPLLQQSVLEQSSLIPTHRLIPIWQREIERILTAAAVFKKGISQTIRHTQSTITPAFANEQFQQALAQAKDKRLIQALKTLQPLLNAPQHPLSDAATRQQLDWLQALGEEHLVNQLSKQRLLYGSDSPLRRQLIHEREQQWRATSNWQGLYLLYAALLTQSIAEPAHFNTAAGSQLLCQPEDWLCLLAETRLRQGHPRTALTLLLMLPEYRKPLAILVEAAYKADWLSVYNRYVKQLPAPASAFWAAYYQQQSGKPVSQEPVWPVPSVIDKRPQPRYWQDINKNSNSSAQSSATVWVTGMDQYPVQYSKMTPSSATQILLHGPGIVRIAYRAIHAATLLDTQPDWLILTDNGKPLHAPLFNSATLSTLQWQNNSKQVGINQYLYYRIGAGEHRLQLRSQYKSWLIDLSLAQPDNLTKNNSQQPWLPTLVNIDNTADNNQTAYNKRVRALWQVEQEKASAAAAIASFINNKPGVNRNASEQSALARLQQRLQQNLNWQSLRYVNQSAGQLSIPVTHWQPESPSWQIRQSISGQDVLPPQVLTGQQSLLIDLYNTHTGDYRLVIEARHLPHSHFKPMKLEIADITPSAPQPAPLTLSIDQPGQYLQVLSMQQGQQAIRITPMNTEVNQWLAVALQHQSPDGHWQTLTQDIQRKYQVATRDQPVVLHYKGPALLRIHQKRIHQKRIHQKRTHKTPNEQNSKVYLQPIAAGWQTITLKHEGDASDQTAYRLFAYQNKSTAQQPEKPLDSAVQSVKVGTRMAPLPEPAPLFLAPSIDIDSAASKPPANYQLPGSLDLQLGFYQRRLLNEDYPVSPEHFLQLSLRYRLTDSYRRQYWRTEWLWRTNRDIGSDVLGIKQSWHWLLPFQAMTVGAQVAFYWQDLEAPLTDMTQKGWAASGYINTYITKRQTLSLHWSHTLKAVLFFRRSGLEYLPPALRPPVDQDIYSDYMNDHRYGLRLSDRYYYSPFRDTRFYTGIAINTNEDFNPFAADLYRIDSGWQQLIDQLSIDMRYRMQYVRADRDRQEEGFTPQWRLQLNWHPSTQGNRNWQLHAHYHYDQVSGASAFGIGISHQLDNGALYDDFTPGEIDFRALRGRQQQGKTHQVYPSGTKTP